MRLLHTQDLTLKEFVGRWPDYAILSHTWEDDEVLFADIANLEHARSKAGFRKIQEACRAAADDGLKWIWIDTCCIDKSSSAELSEALNSMFHWYEGSDICYAYISDMLPGDDLSDGLKRSRWVTRGWTLQELIAPKKIRFFDRDWYRRSGDGGICDFTGIDPDVLYGRRPLSSVPISRRMSWAASRMTTRIEDRANIISNLQPMPPAFEPIYSVAEPGLLRTQGVRKGAFIFQFVGRFSTFFSFDGIEAQPRTHYDRANRLFFTLERPRFVGQLRLPRSSIYPDLEPTSIICGLSDDLQPWCWIGTDAQARLWPAGLMSWIIPTVAMRNNGSATRSCATLRAHNPSAGWLDIEVRVSIEPSTFPDIDGGLEVQVHVVHVDVSVPGDTTGTQIVG
ncbi:HET domain-containing protein [Apiospora hydei]|uniref:HET domain-containing protein n=1 Tax=Apiospora hydei TaxID=1337664 RepID=A0ABR1UTD2_9PEZI